MTSARPHPPELPVTVPWRAVALPAEHGGWGFLTEPVVLGLVLAPSAAGLCLALAALAAFLARHPLRLWLIDRRKGVRYPRTALAERVFVAYAASALALAVAAFALASASFWLPLAVAAPIGLLAVAFDARGRSREALPEAAGAVALGGSATAIALAGVLYVRARIRLDRGLPAGPRAVHAGHGAALLAAAGLAAAGWAPWLSALVFLVLLLRSAWGLSSLRRPVRPQVLGFQELGYGLLTLLLLAVGYRLGA